MSPREREKVRRRAAIQQARFDVESGPRVRLSKTLTIPAAVIRDIVSEAEAGRSGHGALGIPTS